MKTNKKLALRKQRKTFRVRNHLKENSCGRLRISIFRSLQHIYAQVIDDVAKETLVSFSSLMMDKTLVKGDKKEIAKLVGLELGKKALEKEIKHVYFDRGSNIYHGRVKALAEGLRESGLEF